MSKGLAKAPYGKAMTHMAIYMLNPGKPGRLLGNHVVHAKNPRQLGRQSMLAMQNPYIQASISSSVVLFK